MPCFNTEQLSQSDFELCRLWRACIETRLAERITGIEQGWLVDSSQLRLGPYSISTLTRAWDGQGVGSWKVLLYSWFLSAAHQQTNPQPMLIWRVIWQFKISSRFSETFADKQSSVSLSSCLDVFMQSWTGPQSPWIDMVGHWWAGPRGISLQTAANFVCLSARQLSLPFSSACRKALGLCCWVSYRSLSKLRASKIWLGLSPSTEEKYLQRDQTVADIENSLQAAFVYFLLSFLQ